MGKGSYITEYPKIIPRLRFWSDTSDLSTIIHDGGVISKILDKSGLANHAVQETEANRPTLSFGGIQASKYSVAFNGTTQGMIIPTGAGLLTSPSTVFVVSSSDNESQTGRILSKDTSGFPVGSLGIRYASSEIQAFARDFTSNNVVITGSSVVESQANILCYEWRNNDYNYLYSDGVQIISASQLNTQTAQSYIPSIGYRNVAPLSEFFEGKLGEIIIYSGIVSNDERQLLTYYLSNKWGVSVS